MVNKEVIPQTHNHIVDITGELLHQTIDILHQQFQPIVHKDLEVLQVLVSIPIHHLVEITLEDHLLQEDLLTHIHLPLETLTKEMPLLIQVVVIPLPLVVIILQHPNLVPLLAILLNLFLLPLLKTRMSHQNHQTCLLGGQDLRLPIVTLLQ